MPKHTDIRIDSDDIHDIHADDDVVDDVTAQADVPGEGAHDVGMDSGVSFAELGVPEPLVRVLAADGKATAFPIQADTLADSLAGRDLLGRGRTGSGKTLAFAIPLVARLGGERSGAAAMRDFRRMRRRGEDDAAMRLPHPHGLVLAPTRELVNQIDEVIRPLADAYGLKTVTVYGGVKQGRQVSALRDGADIVVACPGRLEDLLRQGLLSLESVRIAVLDEADEMADMGFLPAVTRLLGQIDPHSQHMLFSATLDHGVDGLVKRFLRDARVHAVDSAESHVDEMTHHVFVVTQGNKHELVRQLASGMGKRILFTRTKYQAKKMAAKLVKAGIPAVDLQGNLSQNQRDRHLAAFSDGKVRVLVATDVAARGVDISGVELVVQVEPPADPKSFLHRSGRTARAGHSGDVVTLVLPGQEKEVRQMMRRAGLRIRSVEVTPTSPEVRELVGEHAPLVTGWELPKPQPQKPAGTGRRSRAGRGRVRGGEARGGAGAVRDGADKRGADKRGADNRGGGKRGAVARNGEERRRGRNGAGAGARGGASGGFRRHRKKAAPFRMGTRH